MTGLGSTALMLLISKTNISNREGVGYTGLMAAIIEQAQKDAQAGDLEAIDWLAGKNCSDMCFVLGYDHENILDWVMQRIENKKVLIN